MTIDIICRTKDAIYLRLPLAMQTDCGGCSCDQCKADPKLAKWDALCVPLLPGDSYPARTAHTVHMPDGCVPQFKEHMRRKGLLVEGRAS
jgi:hypothetical protein